ncbi:MAG: hypothetical protein RI897_707 [Verrucomicrobiota bacterium]|jgi:hypothetical protein
MFLIPAGQKPDSTDRLQQLLGESLNLSFQGGDGNRRLTVTGAWPSLEKLEVNLTGLTLDPFRLPPAPDQLRPAAEASLTRCEQLEIEAAPLRLAPAGSLFLKIRANGVEFTIATDRQNRNWWTPSHFTSGQVATHISGKDLEHVFLENARQAAAAHGITVEEGRLQLRQTGTRQLHVNAELCAKKLFVKGRVALQGTLDLDEQLNIRFSGLDCSGQGMIGSLATQFLRPHLATWNQRTLPLLANILPNVRLHHVELQTGNDDQIRATAELGGVT